MTNKELSEKVEFNTDKLFNHQKRIVQLEKRVETLEQQIQKFKDEKSIIDMTHYIEDVGPIQETQFKVGDKVRQINKNLIMFDKIGTVCGVKDGEYVVYFQLGEREQIAYFSAEDLELYMKSKHEFKVGDRVQFKSWEELEKENISLYTISSKILDKLVGTYATIQEIDGTFMKSVRLADFSINDNTAFLEGYFYNPDMLKPATDEPKCKFKVGDRVKVNSVADGDDILNNQIATIKKIYPNDILISYFVEFDNKKLASLWVTEKVLEPYTEPRWTFTDDEKTILRAVSENYNYLVRSNDANDTLWLFENEPTKNIIFWSDKTGKECVFEFYNHLFQSIKWEDEEPCEFRKYL